MKHYMNTMYTGNDGHLLKIDAIHFREIHRKCVGTSKIDLQREYMRHDSQ